MIDLTQITALPVTRQIEIMQEIATGEGFRDLTFVTTRNLDQALEQLHRDAVDQAAAYPVCGDCQNAARGSGPFGDPYCGLCEKSIQGFLPLAEPMWFRPGSVGL